MYIDWITWGIWLLGFIILVMWIWIPYKEFRKLLERRKTRTRQAPSADSHKEAG